MKKRWLVLAMAAVMALALAGCKKTSDAATTTAAKTEAPAATTAAPAETQAPETEAPATENGPAIGEDEGDPDDLTAEALTAETVAD